MKKSKKTWLWEFIKKLLVICTSIYIVERVFIMVMICLHEYENIDVFVQTGSDVFTASVISYAIKAGIENVFKIRSNPDGISD